jgi:hypothetical protein
LARIAVHIAIGAVRGAQTIRDDTPRTSAHAASRPAARSTFAAGEAADGRA